MLRPLIRLEGTDEVLLRLLPSWTPTTIPRSLLGTGHCCLSTLCQFDVWKAAPTLHNQTVLGFRRPRMVGVTLRGKKERLLHHL